MKGFKNIHMLRNIYKRQKTLSKLDPAMQLKGICFGLQYNESKGMSRI